MAQSFVEQNGVFFIASEGTINKCKVWYNDSVEMTGSDGGPGGITNVVLQRLVTMLLPLSTMQWWVEVRSCLNWDDWLTNTIIASSLDNGNLDSNEWNNIKSLQYAENADDPTGCAFVIEYTQQINNGVPLFAIRFDRDAKVFESNWMQASASNAGNEGFSRVGISKTNGLVFAFGGNASGGVKGWSGAVPTGS